ncbi:Bgt-20028-2 [Blumeria graminis f. sp. tritici]|uniref:non-specific serine/threonine protein kinase n=1 Tax=Blumeria graminis f. sp. tritici TaxID=62690 RepID=A0A9X9MED1_BLUGR|nr:Bgt-20028-2 [Blumeria graminis f. sp. tritici]
MFKLSDLFRDTETAIQKNLVAIKRFDQLIEDILDDDDLSHIVDNTIRIAETTCHDVTLLQSSGQLLSTLSTCAKTIKRDTSEASGFDKTAAYLAKAVQSELQDNVFSGISNFWDVFFEGKAWSKQTSRIWECYTSYEKAEECERTRTNQSIITLKEEMTETQVWEWLDFFREKFLNQLNGPIEEPLKNCEVMLETNTPRLRAQYCNTKVMKSTIRTAADAQADFVIRSGELSGDKPQWEDVRVVAEFTKQTDSSARKAKFTQLSRYVREIFCAQPLRRFVHCFFFLKTKFELWVFDRTGAYSSGLKSIVSEKEMFVRAISSYLLMSDEELGLDLSTSKVGENLFVTINGINDDPTMQFKINPEPIVRPQRLITRGTTCFETVDKLSVVKYAWTSVKGCSEIDFLKVALPVRGVVNYITSDEVYRTSEHLGNLDFTDADAWDLKTETLIISRGTHLMQPTVSPWDRDRKLIRIAITPRGQPLNTSKTTLEFIVGIRDAILGHRRLYDRGILHGDISEGNIVLTSPNAGDESKGMLIDLDHSVGLIESLKTDDELSLTGTMKFMAIERLQVAVDNEPTIQRTIRHDLESFFYVFLVGCIEYEVVPESKSRNLDSWCTRDVASNYTSKVGYVGVFEVLVLKNFTPSFLGLKDLANSLKTILFGEIGQNYTTPYDCSSMYEEIIGAFNKTIQQITGKINLRLSKIVIPIDTSLTDKSSITQIDQS